MTAPVTGAYDATATLGSDNKTVTITLTNALTSGSWGSMTNGDIFQVITTGVKDASMVNTLAKTTTNVTYSDTVAPTLVSATASAKTTTNQINLTFSEPIDRSVASVTINGVAATLTAGATTSQVVVNSGSNLVPGTTYNLTLLNFKDTAGNLMSTNPLNTTVTVTADTSAPTVLSATVVRDSLIEVQFSKPMNTSTVNSTNLKVYDTSLGITGITEGAVIVKPNTTDNTTFQVPLTALPFNSSGVFNGVLAFTGSLQDSSGNALSATTQNITITKDVTAPSVASATYKNVTTYGGQTNANGFIVVKFNEPVAASAAAATYVVVDNTGAAVATPISARAINTSDNTELVLSLNAAVATGTTSYTVVMPSSAVTDLSISNNPSATSNQSVTVSAGAPVVSDTTAPVVASATPVAATTATSGTTIAVAFTELGSGLDSASTINTSNYTLNGQPLPSGSYITVAGTTATINIPAGSFTSDGSYYLNVSGVKDKAGNIMTNYASSALALKADVKPSMTTAVLNSNGSVTLGFNQNIAAVAGGTAADLAVKLNGTTLIAPAYSLADGVGADAGKYVLTVGTRHVGIAAVGGTVTAPTGTYTGSATNVMKFTYIDVDGSGSFTAGDIVLSAVDTGNTTAITDAADAAYDLNKATSLTISTVASPATIESTQALTLPVKGSTTLTVK